MKRPVQLILPTFLAVAVVAAPGGPIQAQSARRFTFGQAVTAAVERGPQVQIATAGVEGGKARVNAASAQRFPVLRLEGNIQYWNKPLDVVFVQGPAPGTDVGMQPMTMQPMGAPALRVRNQVTSQVTLTLAQPISGLLVVQSLVNLEAAGLGAARAEHARARLDTALRASDAYLRLLQAEALAGVATKSVGQMEAQVSRAQVLEKNGVMGMVDVLRLTSARDAAKGVQVQTRAGVEIARAALVLALNLPPGRRSRWWTIFLIRRRP